MPEQLCLATAERLGEWTRVGLSRRDTTQVEAHLDRCEHCRALAGGHGRSTTGRWYLASAAMGALLAVLYTSSQWF
jgi:hypothetical protein